MSNEQEKNIIREFSAFGCLSECNSRHFFKLKPDLKLERTLKNLVDVPPLSNNKDAWARYFLVFAAFNQARVGGSKDEEKKEAQNGDGLNLETVLDILAVSEFDLESVITHLVAKSGEINQEVETIYRELVNRKNESAVANFLNNPSPDLESFLSAYLQKIGYYAARKFYGQRIKSSPYLQSKYSLKDCFRIAEEGSSQPIKLLKKFNFHYRNTIKTYANCKLGGFIYDKIKQKNIYLRTQGLSDYGLLRIVRKKELKEALVFSNEVQDEVFCLTLQCYQEIYQPRQIKYNRLQEPNQEQFQAIADRYNQLRQKLNIASEFATWESIQSRLKASAKAVREYRKPSVDIKIEDIDKLEGNASDSLDYLIQKEAIFHIRIAFETAFSELPDNIQKSLRLWRGLNFSQADVVCCLGHSLGVKKQSPFSRKISKYINKNLSQTLIQELSKRYPAIIAPDNDIDRNVSQLQDSIKDYLNQFCQNSFSHPLQVQWQQFEREEKELLKLRYCLMLEEKTIAVRRDCSESEVHSKLTNFKQRLRAKLEQYVTKNLDIDLSKCSGAEKKLTEFIEMWLENDAMSQN